MGVTIPAESATDTSTGTVELATAAEVTTGTDTERAITPEALANSTPVFDGSGLTNLSTGSTVTLPDEGDDYDAPASFVAVVPAEHSLPDEADLLASPGDWTVYNAGASLASAAASGGVITFTSDGTSNVGETAAEGLRRTFDRRPGYPFVVIAHLAAPDAASMIDFENVAVVVSDAGGFNRYIRAEIAHSTAPLVGAYSKSANSSATAALTDGEAATGVLVRITIQPDGTAQVDYRKTASTSDPSEDQWTLLKAWTTQEVGGQDRQLDVRLLNKTDAAGPSGHRGEYRRIAVHRAGDVTVT